MPAHLRDIVYRCDSPGCPKNATVQLYNTFNSPMGRFCGPHGKQALTKHQENLRAQMERHQ